MWRAATTSNAPTRNLPGGVNKTSKKTQNCKAAPAVQFWVLVVEERGKGVQNPARNEYGKREVIDLLNPIQVLSVLFRFGCLHRFSFQ